MLELEICDQCGCVFDEKRARKAPGLCPACGYPAKDSEVIKVPAERELGGEY
jgi:rubrerythrin